MRLPFVLALALVAAGCLGDDEPAGAAKADIPTPATPDIAADPAAPGMAHESLPLPASIVLKQGVIVCPPQGRNHCVAPTGTPTWAMQDWIEGEVVSIRMVATWTAASPASSKLHAYAGGCFGVEEDYTCETLVEFDAVSPIQIDIPSVSSKFNYYYVGLQVTDATPYAAASTEQQVALEGEVLWHRA